MKVTKCKICSSMCFLKEVKSPQGPNRNNGLQNSQLFIDMFVKRICTVAVDQLNNTGVLLPVGHANIIVNFLLPSKNNIGKAEVITSSRHICEVDNLLHFGYEVDNVLHLEGEQDDEDKMTFDGIRNNYATIYNQQGVLDKDIEQEIVEDFLKLTFDRGTREHDFIKSPDHRGGQIVVTSSGALNTIDVLVKSTIPPKDDDDILTLGDVSKENLAQLLRQGFHETDVYIYMRKSALPRILKEGVTSDAFDEGKKDWSWRNSVDESGRRTRYFSATKRKNEEVAVSSFFDLVTADRIFKRFEYYATRSSSSQVVKKEQKIKISIWMVRPMEHYPSDRERICLYNGVCEDRSSAVSWMTYADGNCNTTNASNNLRNYNQYQRRIQNCELLLRYEYRGRKDTADDLLMYILQGHPPDKNDATALIILKVYTYFSTDAMKNIRLMEFDTSNIDDNFRSKFPRWKWIEIYKIEISKLLEIIIDDHSKMEPNNDKISSDYILACEFECGNERENNIPHDILGRQILEEQFQFTRERIHKGKRIKSRSSDGNNIRHHPDVYQFHKAFPKEQVVENKKKKEGR